MALLNDDEAVDPNTEPAANGFDIIPDGTKVIAQITENDVKYTSTGGKMVCLTWQIIEEGSDWVNRNVWQNINVVNASEKAQQIGRGQIVTICKAVGFNEPCYDLDVLMGIPCIITIGVEPAQGQYKAKNTVKSVYPYSDAQAPAAAPAQVPAPAPAARPAASAARPPIAPRAAATAARPVAAASTGVAKPWTRPGAAGGRPSAPAPAPVDDDTVPF